MGSASIIKSIKRGFIIPIGGNEDKEKEKKIHRKFVDLCGAENGEIIIDFLLDT